MKRFIISMLCVAVFFVGLGALVENVGARFKSDEKALELIRQARQAIGGDTAVAGVRSMTISGKTTRTVKGNGGETVNIGATEIALQLPDKLMKTFKVEGPEGSAGEHLKQFDVIVTRRDKGTGEVLEENIEGGEPGAVKKIVIKKIDGTTEEINGGGERKVFVDKIREGDAPIRVRTPEGDDKNIIVDRRIGEHGAIRQNELLRTTLSLLLSAPEGMEVSYTFGGEVDVDGTACNLVNADFGGSAIKLFLSKASSLPVMVSYTGHAAPMMFKMLRKVPEGAEPTKDVKVFRRELAESSGIANVEHQVRFADYRSVGGVQLPYKWTTTIGGTTTEVFDVTAYDVNPANIGEKFQHQKVLVRSLKDSK